MYLKFESVDIEGFQSIESASVDLSQRGVVLVRGINNYESNASSNGSGKSSIFQAIMYCVYGKTSDGISDPSNRYYKDGCMVKLNFYVDSQEYTIIRSIKHTKYKTGLIVYKGSDNISARNKSDTDKIIRSDIMPINQDIFLSTVFLSQGFSGRLSVLAPSGRKERIETLTDTASQVDEFRDRIMEIKNKYSENYDGMRRDLSYKQGSADNVKRQIDELSSEIERIDRERPDGNIEDLKNNEASLDSISKKCLGDIINQNKIKSELFVEITGLRMKKQNLSSDNESIKHEIADLKSGKPCPTCGRPMLDGPIDPTIIDKKLGVIKDNFNIIREIDKSLEDLETKFRVADEHIKSFESTLKSITDKKRNISTLITKLLSFRDTTDDKKKVYELTKKLEEIQESMVEVTNGISLCETRRDVAHHCTSLVSKQFRGYLLNETIEFMNSRLAEYSSMLFSNSSDRIHLTVDSTKLDIYLGDALYDTLSGGERKKVDIALVLTQRDLALNISGVSCNLLILDEIIENCDQTATSAVLDMLSRAAGDIESMFIVSHNSYTMPYDSVMTVVKDKSRMSKIFIS